MADFENASRGLIGALKPCIVKNSNGRVVWNAEEYAFLQGECPETANPKLWRQGQLSVMHGLFEVVPGIYQVRGLDLSNMTIVEGRDGVIVIDPLVSNEVAEAALSLYREHRGNRQVTGLIYSHSHIDHFGGARGVLPRDADASFPIIAPEGFVEEALSENIYAGHAMRQRAVHMYGSNLPRSADGQIGCGLGMATSKGTTSFIPPNVLIGETGEERTVDGVRIVFQIVSGTEAPSEFNFHFPDHKALYIAECATHCMHNIITLRGALVRDAKAWSHSLDEAMVLFGDESDALFAGHHWPTWGHDEIAKLVLEQRDLYAFLHDQTLRMMNLGMTGIEIAEQMKLPPTLENAWHTQGYYGSLSHNVKGIYQRYMSWFDGNPAHLWQHPPVEEGKRYVACMGGVDTMIHHARKYAEDGDLRFAATLLGHAVAAEPSHAQAKESLAAVFTKLGHGALNATWRNYYLSGAQELRYGKQGNTRMTAVTAINPLLSVEQWWASMSIQLDGKRAANESFSIDIHVSDKGERWRLTVSNGALTYRLKDDRAYFRKPAGTCLTLAKGELKMLLEGNTAVTAGKLEGDGSLLMKLLSLLSIATSGQSSRMAKMA